jgi:hypothetical protein
MDLRQLAFQVRAVAPQHGLRLHVRIMDKHVYTILPQSPNQTDDRALPQVICAGLKAQAEHGHTPRPEFMHFQARGLELETITG